jgi:hypothetical protein
MHRLVISDRFQQLAGRRAQARRRSGRRRQSSGRNPPSPMIKSKLILKMHV